VAAEESGDLYARDKDHAYAFWPRLASERESLSCALIVLEFWPSSVGAIRALSAVARLTLSGEFVITREWLDDGVLKDDPATLFFEAGETLEMAPAGRAEDSIRAMGGAVELRSFSRAIRGEFAPGFAIPAARDLAHFPGGAPAGCAPPDAAVLADVTT
jgi:hypothetical protein